jgi:hypothetical protein
VSRAKSGPGIKDLASAVFDNGRRGQPRAGCDCVQCFGYCMIDAGEAARKSFVYQGGELVRVLDAAPLVLE